MTFRVTVVPHSAHRQIAGIASVDAKARSPNVSFSRRPKLWCTRRLMILIWWPTGLGSWNQETIC